MDPNELRRLEAALAFFLDNPMPVDPHARTNALIAEAESEFISDYDMDISDAMLVLNRFRLPHDKNSTDFSQ